MPDVPSSPLALPVTRLWGVGPERAAQLARLGLRTIDELLLHRPRRHEDRRHLRAIAQLELRVPVAVQGAVVAQGVKRWRHGTKSLYELILDDGTARLHCRWWNRPFMEDHFRVGDQVLAFGKPVGLKPRTIDHPETEVIEGGEETSIHLNRIAPIYPLTEGLPQRWLRALIWRALTDHLRHVREPWPGSPPPPLPTRAQAIQDLHFPTELAATERARRRLALDEFVALQQAIQQRRRNLRARARGLPCRGDNRLIRPFLARLGFELTEAQTRVLREFRLDLGGACPMRRLLQGDVGSGKTVVAAVSALMTIESGYRVALMAPTEILAEQHWRTFNRWFSPLGVRVELRTGSLQMVDSPPGLEAEATRKSPAKPGLTIGTHALIEAAYMPENLGLVIIDEQHKFGVVQREQLVRKGRYPHLLVMTATPIPRTLGLTLYGDLDISILDKLPPGRGRVRTFVRGPAQLSKVEAFIHQKLVEGRQAYVVYPRVEEADLKTGVKAVRQEYERWQRAFAPYRVGLLHGRLTGAEKEAVMAAFRANTLQVLVATAVVEVGLDVPNATVLLVENAETFGLAQLHQLRGRIGRGGHEGWCILVASAKTLEARRRLQVLADTNDGFRIAEADLDLRGPGELLGQEQTGAPSFRFGDLRTDLDLIESARDLAAQAPAPRG